MSKFIRICTIFMVISIVKTGIPTLKNENLEVIGYVKSILLAQKFRVVVLLKSSDSDNSLLQDISLITNFPTLLINVENIHIFNGKCHMTFSYEVIYEEAMIYIIFISDMKSFSAILKEVVKIYFWRNRQKTIVIFQKGSLNEMEELFKLCWEKRITNIIFVFSNTTYTYNPFFEDFKILLNTTNVFYDKFQDVNNYTVKFSMFETAMDMTLYKNNEYIGRDAFLAKTITHAINANYIYLPPRDGITYGLKFSNGSMTGVFSDVATFHTDFAINSRLVKLQFENILEGTYPHDREDIACLVPKSAKQPEYKKFVILFPKTIWILLGISMILYTIIWYFATAIHLRVFFKVLFDIIAMSLGCSIQDQTGFKLRTILISYRFYIFLLIAAYQGVLTSVLTVPIQLPEINTLSDLERSGVQIIAATRFKDMLQANQGSTLSPTLINRITTVPDDPDIDKVIKKRGNYAIILKETFALRAVLDKSNYKDGKEIYRIMDERPMPSQVCYAVRYGSPALPRINTLLRRFQESGLNNYWKSTTIRLMIIASHVKENVSGAGILKVTLENISASFYILGIGLATSSIVFVIELIVFIIQKYYYNKK